LKNISNPKCFRFHNADLNINEKFINEDIWINLADEPDHQELCNREQKYFLESIQKDLDIISHAEDALNSLRIAFACDESIRTGNIVYLG
jgi:hypothetical protein